MSLAQNCKDYSVLLHKIKLYITGKTQMSWHYDAPHKFIVDFYTNTDTRQAVRKQPSYSSSFFGDNGSVFIFGGDLVSSFTFFSPPL